MKILSILFTLLLLFGCGGNKYDLIIKNGLIADGSGEPAYRADVAVDNGRIMAIRPHINQSAVRIIDAEGLVVAPGFIDMLSWACGPILYNGHVPSVVRQGITTAVFGEGWSMGPVNANVVKEMSGWWPEYNITYDWKTLADYLRIVEQKGTAVNVCSYVGATTLRMFVVGFEDRRATEEELEQMKNLLRTEMEAGAMGLASSLVYTPAFYADTHELIELARVAAEYGGVYASHLRGEGSGLLAALEEFLTICREAGISGQIYHLKAAGKENWPLLQQAIAIIGQARQEGLNINADIYPYTAGATGLSAMMPPWSKEGGDSALVARLHNPDMRKKIAQAILNEHEGWENFYWMAGGGKNILISYLLPRNRQYQGKTIAEVAEEMHKDEISTIFDLLIAEQGKGGGIYFIMSEQNVRRKMKLPWVMFCTDEDAYQPNGLMGSRNPHPRAYGTFPKILSRYVREEKLITLEEAVRRMSALPARKLGLKDRGLVREKMAADLVVFDAQRVQDHAEYTNPHQFSEGIEYVIVNGKIVVDKSVQTEALPGKALFKKAVRKK